MSCVSCGATNPDGNRYCGRCGAPLQRDCGECGQANPPDHRFCGKCGAALTESADAASRAGPTPPPGRVPGAYTPQHLAEKILRSKASIEGERKTVTVMFADVKGSMELAAQLDPEDWHAVLDRFFQILSEGVHRYEGTVNQYTGDGIMALFGAPIAHEDHPQRACFAALHLRGALQEYAQELRREYGLDLSARIGINCGDVVVGKIGDDLRMDYTAQGHTVGLAQRMEQLAEPGLPYLTEEVARLVEGYFQLRDLGEFRVKGASEAIRAFGLEGVGTLRTRLDMSRSRGLSRFVGRTAEIEVLEGALARAVAGRGGVVGVVAEAGVGKSRLCFEFAEACRNRGIAVYEAHCVSHGAALPLLPILELMREFFGVGESDPALQAREKIAGRLLLLDPALAKSAHLAFDLLGVADPAEPTPTIDPAAAQRRLIDFVRRLILARSGREPAVLLVDDVHWIDSGSEAFLIAMADAISESRTLVLMNFRPEYETELAKRALYEQLPLHPLGREATDELVGEMLGRDPSLEGLLDLVCERTEGNPFYVEELVRSLIDSGNLVGAPGDYRLVAEIETVEIPISVQAILAARIDRLSERDKRVLQTAAVIGRVFPRPLLGEVCDLPESEIDASLSVLCDAALVREEVLYPEVEYAFRHPLTHEVAEKSQLARRRREVHSAVAAALERDSESSSGERAALVAHHWENADVAERAAVWHRRAAEWIAGSDSNEAARHWHRVRDLADEIADEQLASELGERARLLLIELAWRQGLTQEEADRMLLEGERWARRREDPRALARFYNAYAIAVALSLGQLEQAQALVEEGLRIARSAGDSVLVFALELRRALILDYRGASREFLEAIETACSRSLEDQEAASSLVGYFAPAFALGSLAAAQLQVGRAGEATETIVRAVQWAREREEIEVLGWLVCFEAAIAKFRGETSRALRCTREGMAIAEQVGSRLSFAVASAYTAAVNSAVEDDDAVIALATEVVAANRVTVLSFLPTVLGILATSLARRGRLEEAGARCSEALDLAVAHGFHSGEIDACIAQARVSLAGSECREASRWIDRAAELVRSTGARVALPELAEIRAEIAEQLGERETGCAALASARDLYREMGAPLQAARIEERLATW